MATKKEEHFEIFSYIIGIASIVFGVLQPPVGLGLGITGLFLAGKLKTELAKKARKLNILGVVVSIILAFLGAATIGYLASKGLINLQ